MVVRGDRSRIRVVARRAEMSDAQRQYYLRQQLKAIREQLGEWDGEETDELRERIINETGLPISFGLSANKTVSKIATGEAKPNGELEIARPAIKPFLDPLPIQKIPMLGKKTAHLLRSMGIVNIGVLSNMPPVLLTRVLGSNGLMLWKKANGQDDTPVVPYEDAKSMSTETTFETDVTDRAEMERILSSMTERLAFRMRKNNRLTGTVTVKLR